MSMKLSRRQFGTALSGAALAAAYGRPGWAQAPVVMKFSHVVANDTPKGKGSSSSRNWPRSYTGGKVKVEVYPNSQLFKDKEEIEALQLGSVQLLGPATAKFAPLGAKEFEALDLPFLFADEATYERVMKGEVGKWLFKKLEPKGISGLAFLGQWLSHGVVQPSAAPAGRLPGPQDTHLGVEDRGSIFP